MHALHSLLLPVLLAAAPSPAATGAHAGGAPSGAGLDAGPPPPPPLIPRLLTRGPVVSDVTATSAEIRWEPVQAGATLVVDSGGKPIATVDATVGADGVSRARATGLAPDTLYGYRVRTASGHESGGSFRTFPDAASPLSFIAFGDTRTDHATHARIAARIAVERPDFVVNTGDLVGDGRIPEQWDVFFRMAAPLLESTPFFPAMGNHDSRGLLNDTMFLRWFGRGRYYEVRAGSLILLFVDTTLAYGGGSAQGAWLSERLAAARASVEAGDASWIVALHHHPPFSSAHHGSQGNVASELVPLYERYGVRLVLNGHDHVYERLERNGITYVVTGGGGAPLYDFGAALPESRVRVAAHHYLRVDADRERLAFVTVDLSGNVLDRHEMRRGDATEPALPPLDGDGLPVGASLASLAGAALVAWLIARRIA